MKSKTIVLSCLTFLIIMSIGFEYSPAQQKDVTQSFKIGTVSIVKIFRNCKRSTEHKTKIITEQNKIRAEFDNLSKQLSAQEDMLNALKRDSSDYMAQREEYINTHSKLEAQQTINKEQTVLKEYRWSKELYQDILRITTELAEQKGLDMVLEKNEIDSTTLSINEFNQTLRNHKVLYSGGCIDITDEVTARLDKEE